MLLVATVVLSGAAYDSRTSGGVDMHDPTGDLTWDFNPGDSTRPPSVVRLDQAPKVDGAIVSPTFLYGATDATASAWAPWTYGDGLNVAGAGTAPTTASGSPLLGTGDTSVIFNNAKSYQATASTSGDLTTQDFRLSVLAQWDATSGHVMLEKRSGAGYTVDVSGGAWRLTISDGTHVASCSTAALGTIDATEVDWADWIVDKSGSCQAYVNGLGSGSATDVSAVGSLTNSGKLTIGADSSLANGYAARVMLVGLWAKASWFVSYEQRDVVQTQFARLTATYARCNGSRYPDFSGEPGGALRKYDGSSSTKIWYVGPGWPRVEKNSVQNALLLERAGTNLALQADDASTTWAKINGPDSIVGNVSTVTWPDGSTNGDAIVMDATNGAHGASQGGIAIPDQQDYSWALYAKSGDHACIYLEDTSNATFWAYFDLSVTSCVADGYTRCTAAVLSSGTMSYAKYYGSGIFRVDIQPQGSSSHTATVKWQVCDGAGDKVTFGDGATKSLYVWRAQVSPYADYADSPIGTTTVTVTRASTVLTWPGSGNLDVAKDSIICTIQRPVVLDNTSDYEGILTLSDGGLTAQNYATVEVSPYDEADLRVYTSGVQVADIADGVGGFGPDLTTIGTYTHVATIQANNYAGYANGTTIGTDTSGAFPTLNTIKIGAHGDDGHFAMGSVVRCCITSAVGRTSC